MDTRQSLILWTTPSLTLQCVLILRWWPPCATRPRIRISVETVEVVETHISSVLLAGDYAYKLKKPVDLGFVDFSMLARRRHFCEEEVRLNRRSAPDLYLGVVPITRSRDGASLCVDGDGTVIDYAVRMRRFARDACLDQMAQLGTLHAPLIDQLAEAIAAFHGRCDSAPSDRTFGTPDEIRRWTMDNLRELQRLTRIHLSGSASSVWRAGPKPSSRGVRQSLPSAEPPATCASATATCTWATWC